MSALKNKQSKPKQKNNVVNVLNLINPAHYSLWLADESHIVAKGGRSSFKSSVISLRLVRDFLKDDQGNVICLRKVAKYLRTSIYEQIKWAIYMLGVQDEFTFLKSPMQILHKETGTAFYFFGVDDPMKLKSAKIAVGYVMALWFEELAEFAGVEDIDIVEDTFIREDIGENDVRVFFSYNPPRNPYSWVNEWADSKTADDDYFLHHSTYLDDELGFMSPQMKRKILKYMESDHDYYRYMYLGEIIGLGDTIYNMNHFQPLTSIPDDDDIVLIDIASDTGHQQSATTHLAIALTKKQRVILLDTYYYSPAGKLVKKAPSELSTEYAAWLGEIRIKFKNKAIDNLSIDSAEGALRNQIYKDHGLMLHPVRKFKKGTMIEYVESLLVDKRFFYLDTENNKVFIDEHKRYRWDEKTVKTPEPKVVKEDDHTCDAFQYYVMDNRSKLGLTI